MQNLFLNLYFQISQKKKEKIKPLNNSLVTLKFSLNALTTLDMLISMLKLLLDFYYYYYYAWNELLCHKLSCLNVQIEFQQKYLWVFRF